MEIRDIVELATLIGGIVVSVYGAIKQIRDRKAGDAALERGAGADALAQAKAAQGVALDTTYLAVEAELAAARRLLSEHGLLPKPPAPPAASPPVTGPPSPPAAP